jgi:3-isopropylmalate/(R)-2-methylmalate dehydratase small subunit
VGIKGKVHKYGANVNTDVIIPARYLNVSDADDLARHCMEDIDAGFVDRVEPGDIIVADANFGCGSSREHAPLAIKAAGVGCVIARSFARIFYRNALNIGLPILECADAVDATEAGDVLNGELSTGEIVNETRGLAFRAEPFPDFMLELIEAGGLIEYTRRKIAAGGR